MERGTGGLPTAFTASAGSGDLTVALCVEYDALPDIGHACGHNLIAGALSPPPWRCSPSWTSWASP